MNRIQHLIEPNRLFLSWQRPMDGLERRTRRIVAEIVHGEDGEVLRYFTASTDFEKARKEGFQGYPAFRLESQTEHKTGVLDAFTRRLPPRNREDFGEYLAQYRLPEDFKGSDMALLAYTGAKLPGDGFEIVPDLTGIKPPLEIVIEVAGFRHQGVPVSEIALGDPVNLVAEPDNEADPEAIAMMHARGRIGYIARPYCASVAEWLRGFTVEARIERINGKPDRPLVYLFIKVS